jgi:ABC-type transport system involved in cytochrome c biogenesis permease component
LTFLPVLERELRVAARRRSTFWFRVIAAIVAVIIGCMVLAFYKAAGTSMASIGGTLFLVLGWMALFAALFCGLFFTADCLSEEKREGTIGLLFLTDLRGHDVVGAKLLSQSLRSFYGLLAIFPVLAMIMLMGGVTGMQFWKTNLALANALFCSLVVGIFVSARSRNSQKALAGTFCVLLLFVAGGPIFDQLFGLYRGYAAVTSPIYVFTSAQMPKLEFWIGLGLCQGIAWTLLIWTCFTLPRSWQESERLTTGARYRWEQFWRYGSAKSRASSRAQKLRRNPIFWLASRERWQVRWLWFGVLAGVALQVAVLLGFQNHGTVKYVLTIILGYLQGLIWLFVYVWTASQASRFFVEARRSGFLELLLATPITVREIVRGNWHSFLKTFGWPLGVMLAVQLVVAPITHYRTYASLAKSSAAVSSARATRQNTNGVGLLPQTNMNPNATATTTNSVTVTPSGVTMPDMSMVMAVVIAIAGVITYGTNLAAISWFGAWVGLTTKNANIAILKTIAYVMVIPFFAISFAAGMISIMIMTPMFIRGATANVMWFQIVSVALTSVLRISVDAVFINSARKKLYSKFREEATKSLAPEIVAPPVIAKPALPIP